MPTLANLMVGLGYDLSALQKGAPEAFRLINEQTLGMSAEMKRASREGAEAFRSIDEMIGIHINRPMTRLLVETFPQFGKALSDVLGGVAFGAVAFAGVELFDRIARGVEKAEKAEKDFQDATRRTNEVFTDALQSYAKAEQMRSLTGLNRKLFEIDSSAIEEARKKIDELAAAMQKESAAAVDAHKWTTEFLAALGVIAHQAFSSQATLVGEGINKQFQEVQQRFDALSKVDALNGTEYGAAFLMRQIDEARTHLQQMQADAAKPAPLYYSGPGAAPSPVARISPQEIADQKQYIDNLEKMQQVQSASAVDRFGQENTARGADAIENARKAIKDAQEAMKGWNDENNRAFESWVRLNAELDKAIAKLNDEVFKETASRAKQAGLGTAVLPPSGAPLLKDQLDLLRVSGQLPGETSIEQQTASWQKAGEVLEQIETPAQKYQTALAMLKELHDEGRISAEQFAAAEAQLGDKFTDAELHLQEMQKRLERLLEQSTSARAGVQAFFLELQVESAQNGKFAFDFLSQGLHGFEEELTKAVFEGKAKWKDLFRSMGEEAFKFMLNKDLSGIFQMLSGTGIGKSIGLGSLIPHLGGAGAGGAELATAATTLQTSSTALLTAASMLEAAASEIGLGGSGAGLPSYLNLPSDSFASYPGFASGTDSFSGGFAWVGEQGPELLNLPAGASVTPGGAVRSGGDSHYYDMRGAVVTEDLMRKAEFANAMAKIRPALVQEAVTNAKEVQRRTPKR